MDADRKRLRQTFDAAAARYDRVRPEYRGALYDDLVTLAGLTPGDHLLEVGARPARRPARWRGAATGSPASSSARSWPRWPGRT
jgi:hypothetical protein